MPAVCIFLTHYLDFHASTVVHHFTFGIHQLQRRNGFRVVELVELSKANALGRWLVCASRT